MVDGKTEEVIRILVDAVEKGDLRPFLKLLSDDVTYVDAYGIESDKNGILGLFSKISTLWPDRENRLTSWATKGNTIWIEMTSTMTHVNDFHGIPPTNKRIENQIVWIMELEAGKIVEIRETEKKNEYLIRQMQE
jgi:ketosteroid isomerase-like protein